MTLAAIGTDHFDGNRNITTAQKNGTGPTLAEHFGSVKTEVDSKLDAADIKTGHFTAAAAGDTVVAFAVAFADANYRLAFSADAAGTDPILKTTTKAAGGFTCTVAAAANVDWIAIHD